MPQIRTSEKWNVLREGIDALFCPTSFPEGVDVTYRLDSRRVLRHSSRMGKRDQGLGAIGLIALAVVLAVLVTVFAPMAAAKTTLDLKDWLGFAGNMLAAIVTVIAAYVAWRAVQTQIGAERDAVMLSILMREEDRLETELHAISAMDDLYSDAYQPYFLQTPSQRLDRMRKAGLSRDVPATRNALQARVGGPIPPMMLENLGLAFSAMVQTLEQLEGPDFRKTTSKKLTPADDGASVGLLELEGQLKAAMGKHHQRKKSILDLLGHHRRRIEASLHGGASIGGEFAVIAENLRDQRPNGLGDHQ
jgi:hypothetical protein